jgi:hypothetical protein
MIESKIEAARVAVEEALRAIMAKPARDGRSMARDAKVIHELAGALTRLEAARVAIFEHSIT